MNIDWLKNPPQGYHAIPCETSGCGGTQAYLFSIHSITRVCTYHCGDCEHLFDHGSAPKVNLTLNSIYDKLQRAGKIQE